MAQTYRRSRGRTQQVATLRIARMPSVSLVAPTAPIRADAAIVGVRGGGGLSLAPGSTTVDAALGGRLVAALQAAGASGRADEVTKIPTLGLADFPLVLATGL